MIDFNFNSHCYGCGACEYSCPARAIHMMKNSEGFLMPIIDVDKCIHCGKCEKACPNISINKKNRDIKVAVHKAVYRTDVKERKSSASGGVAAVLTEWFLETSNVVIGCAWDENFAAKHILVTSISDATRLKGSKYVQSDMRPSYEFIKKSLNQDKKVLFIGTPCQVAAVTNVFTKTNNLFTISLICGGVGSPDAWNAFKDDLEKKYKSKMTYADFRHKGRYGWSSPVALYCFENGKKSDKLSFHNDRYVLEYLMGTFKRNSCFRCQYKANLLPGDLVIGDFWGNPTFRSKSNNMGVSAVLSMTQRGDMLLECLSNKCEICDTTLEDILRRNQPLVTSVKPKRYRTEFFDEMKKSGFYAACRKYSNYENKCKYWLLLILDKTKLFELIKRKITE